MRSKTVARTMFRDPWDPTRDEVLQWSYTKGAFAPVQDFALAIIHNPTLYDLILTCAADASCPKQIFFLGCLYVLVGDAVRSSWNPFPKPRIEHLIDQGIQSDESAVQLWATRARILVNNPQSYTYEDWGLGSRLVNPNASATKKKGKHNRSQP